LKFNFSHCKFHKAKQNLIGSTQAFAWSLQLPLLAILPAHEAHHAAAATVSTDSERQLVIEGAVEGTAAAASAMVTDDGLTTPLLQSPALENGEALQNGDAEKM